MLGTALRSLRGQIRRIAAHRIRQAHVGEMEPVTAAGAVVLGQVARNALAPPARRAPPRSRERATARERVVSLQARRARRTPARERHAPRSAVETVTATQVPQCPWLPTVAGARACAGSTADHAHRPYNVQQATTATSGFRRAPGLSAPVRRAVHTAASPTTDTLAPARAES